MSNYNTLKSAIADVVKQNGNNEITGELLQQALLSMINSLGAGYQFVGVATPSTNPGTPDQNVFYIASEVGTYANFDNLAVADNEVAIFKYNGTWAKETTGAATVAQLNQLGQEAVKINQLKSLGVLTPVDIYSPLPNTISGKRYILKVVTLADTTNAYIALSMSASVAGVTQRLVENERLSAGTHYYEFVSQSEILVRFYMNVSGTYSYTNVESYELFETIDTSESRIDTQISGIVTEVEEIAEKVDELENLTLASNEVVSPVAVTIHKEDNTNGYWAWASSGAFSKDNNRRATDKIEVIPGDKYLISTHLRPASISALLMYDENDGYVGDWNRPASTYPETHSVIDEEFIVPVGVKYIALNSSDTTEPSLKKVTVTYSAKAYSKQESDEKFVPKSAFGAVAKKYGVKWSISDNDDLGERCFDAIGLTAVIGIGNTDGHSDFDDIYPWSEMKRCNISENANGSKVVTFEGETGFALDGSNGNVFVRIPKFYIEKYIKSGYEYRIISESGPIVHPAFIENGKELDEIFVSAFEGYSDGAKMKSIGGVIPTCNHTLAEFLALAVANGRGYTLYDNRTVDAIWSLIAVEYGCRNTNHILGYGIADYLQPIDDYRVLEAAINVNTIKVTPLGSLINLIPAGSNLTICQNNDQEDILAQRHIVSIANIGSTYTEITFDGSPLSVDTNCFIGSAALDTNFCETCGNASKLNWHTGRANFISNSERSDRQNPIRYRWIENVVGNLWHFLPDVTFMNGQMYVCDNIEDYSAHKYIAPYRPVGGILPLNSDNGTKADNPDVNYWITSLVNYIFAKGIPFGKTYDKSLVSTKAFGAYYYLYNGVATIANGGGFDHLYRCNMLTQRAWIRTDSKWYLYGARLLFKNCPTD